MSDNNNNYPVGYGRPPQHTQFKPGQSGNPKGKSKGTKNLATIVNTATKEKIVVNESGKRKSVSKLEIAVKQLVNKAVQGDQKAIMQLLPLVQIIEGRTAADAALTPALSDADTMVMAGIEDKFRQSILGEAAKKQKIRKIRKTLSDKEKSS